jgi:hypothetical protein
MYCPRCGTQATSSQSQFCYECGAALTGPTSQQDASGPQQTGPCPGFARPSWSGSVPGRGLLAADSPLRVGLMAVGALFLLPLILIAGLALVGLAIHALPFIALGVIVYWALSRRRRWSGVRL